MRKLVRIKDILARKRDGAELAAGEIEFFVRGIVSGEVPDYQAAAFLMAAFLRGLTDAETLALTRAISSSGSVLDLSGIEGPKVDKHSTGGVGDKVTLVLGPMVAACGARMAKLSGRGLGHTGGTIDKLEAISGFRTALSEEELVRQVAEVGLAVSGQTKRLCPADGLLYALRDATATIESKSLIASSIMSKKLAAGADAIVLDVKAGPGAFAKTLEDAVELAELLVSIGSSLGKRTASVVTDMSQPLGSAVGNSLEVEEAIDTLKGQGPADLIEVCMVLGIELLLLAGLAADAEKAATRLTDALESGAALEKFAALVRAQGGDVRVIEDPRRRLPHARYVEEFAAEGEGYVVRMDAELIGRSAMEVGAGRRTKEAEIDPAAGLRVLHKVGDYVEPGDPLVQFHTNDVHSLTRAGDLVAGAITIAGVTPPPTPLIHTTVR